MFDFEKENEWQKERKVVFFCQNCGHEEAKWLGQCPGCGEWNTFVEEKIGSGVTKGSTQGAKAVRELVREAKVIPLNDVTAEDDVRCATGIKELAACSEEGSFRDRLCLSAAIPVSESLLCCFKCAGFWPIKRKFYTFREKNRRRRSN